MDFGKNILKTSYCLIIIAAVLFLTLISANTALAVTCIGNNYEQQMPVSGVQPPSVTILGDSQVNEGQTLELTAYEWVDTAKGGSAFFYWCADSGEFQDNSNSNFKTITYTAPVVSQDQTVSIRAKVGDGLGYVARNTVIIAVRNVSNDDPDTPNEDADNDGMPDAWETEHFGNLSRNGTGDLDNDGVSDLNEYKAGTNPKVADSSGEDDTSDMDPSDPNNPHKIEILCPYPPQDSCHNLCNGNYHAAGGDLSIKWRDNSRSGFEDDVTSLDFYYSIDGRTTWTAIAKSVIPNNSRIDTYEWKVPSDFIHRDVEIKVLGRYKNGGVGQGFSEPFNIKDGSNPKVTVSAPASGSVYQVGQPVEIKWVSSFPSSYKVERVDLKLMPSREPIARLTGDSLKTPSYTWYPSKYDLTDKGQIQVTVWINNCGVGEALSPAYFEVKSYHDPSSPWSEPERIFTKVEPQRPNPSWWSYGWHQNIMSPDVLVDKNKDIHVVSVFENSIMETTDVAMGVHCEYESQIYYIKKGDGENWQSQERATNHSPMKNNGYLPLTYGIANPQLAIDSSGYPHVVYEYISAENNNDGREIYYVRKTAGGWSQYKNLSDSYGARSSSISPKIAVDKDDNVYVFWSEEGKGGVLHK